MMSQSLSLYCFIFSLLSLSVNSQELIDISDGYTVPKKTDTDYYWVPIFGTNDIHGKIFPAQYAHPEGTGTYKSGGAEYIYAYKKIIESEWGKDRFLWLDGGDQFQGGLEFMLSNGTIMNKFYNKAGVNAMAIGNHDFDFGVEERQKDMAGSNFIYLSANIKNTTSGKYIYEEWEKVKATEMFTLGDVKIGVIGLATVLTPIMSGTVPSELSFEPYRDIIIELSKKLRDDGANAVLLLPHFGPLCPDTSNKKLDIGLRDKDTEQLVCDDKQEYNILLNSLPEQYIDAVIAAHVHDVSHHWIGNIPVVESSGAFYSHVIYLPFKKDDTGKYTVVKDKIKIEGPLPSCEKVFTNTKRCDYVPIGETSQGALTNYKFHGQVIELDPEMKTLLDDWRAIIDAKLKNIIVDNEEKLVTDNTQETALTNLLTDAGRRITGADIGLFNLGGFRTEWYPGQLNEIDLFLMFPFNNTFVSVEMSGREVIRMLKTIQTGTSVNPSSGLIQLFKNDGNGNIRILDAKLFDGYLVKKIELDKTYTICLNDFLADGGSFFSKVKKWYVEKNRIDYGTIRELMEKYLKSLGKIAKGSLIDPKHPRIRYLK